MFIRLSNDLCVNAKDIVAIERKDVSTTWVYTEAERFKVQYPYESLINMLEHERSEKEHLADKLNAIIANQQRTLI